MAILTDPTFSAGRTSVRPLEYISNGVPLGHYSAVSFSGATASIGAAGILASLRWADNTRYLVLTRLAMNVEVLTAITVSTALDAQAFVFRGSTGNGTGASSTTIAGGNFQKTRATMAPSILLTSTANGEIRTCATAVFTAATGKTNDSAPFGAAFWGSLVNSTGTGVATAIAPGAAVTPGGWQDLYSITSPYQHPLVLSQNEGIEIQTITAAATTGTVKYGFLWQWAEVASF